MLIFFLDGVLLTEFFRVSYTCSGDCSVCDGRCTYTHLLHAHFSAESAYTSHIFMRVTYTHGSSVCKKVFAHVSYLSISPSPFSCFTRLCCSCTVTSETTPDYDFTDDPIHMILPYFPVLKAQDTRHSAPAWRSLATWPSQMQTQDASTQNGTPVHEAVQHLSCEHVPRTETTEWLVTSQVSTTRTLLPKCSTVVHLARFVWKREEKGFELSHGPSMRDADESAAGVGWKAAAQSRPEWKALEQSS